MARKIYIIEDNDKNLKLFVAVLKVLPDIELFTETRGDTGFELIKSGNPDLIILDIQLPEMSGIDICKELRCIEKFKDTPIIAVTSFAMKGDRERIMEAGFTDYVSKPIKISEFRELVLKLLK
ncbi:MAG: response regulator [Promethearchaeota archaeon]